MARTAGHAALVAGGMIISGSFGYVQTLAATHLVSRDAYGVFSVVFTLVIFVGNLTRLGLDGTIVRYLPRYKTQGNAALAVGLVRVGMLGPLGISLMCGALLFVGAPFISQIAFHSAEYATPLREGAILIPLSSIQGMLLNGLLALRAIKWQVAVGKVIEPILTPVMIVVFYLLGLRIAALIFAYVVSIFISVVAGWFLFRRAVRGVTRGAAPRYEAGTWVHIGAAMLFGSMTNSVIQSTDVLGVGAFSTAANVAVYRVADRVSALISLPAAALSSIFSPTIAELHARGDPKKLARMYAVITRWMFSFSLPIFLCCLIFASPILKVFGNGYVDGSAALLVLAVGNLVNTSTGPVASMVAMTSRVRVLWFNAAVRLVTNVVLIVLLVPHYTVIGAAIASSLTIIVSNVLALIEVYWMLHMHPYRRAMLKPILAGGAASLVGIILSRATHHFARAQGSAHIFLYALALVLSFAVVYALVLLLLGLNKEDREIFALVRARLTGATARVGIALR